MSDKIYPCIEFHQYQSDHPDDRLVMFAAPARILWGWAGVPRKGWRLRMLYQRWIVESRKQDVIAYWDQVSKPREGGTKKYLVGPNAITVAIFDDIDLSENQIDLGYQLPFATRDALPEKLQKCARIVLQRMGARLTIAEKEILSSPEAWTEERIGENYVLESLTQVKRAADDPEEFIISNAMTDDEVRELVQALEALCRPAVVVDGQHRLYGAANTAAEVWLPVVAIPNSPWMEQIYQFVVINEKAKKVESSLLTDIFGSSLTKSEQAEIQTQLAAAGAQVEPRIAAVIAGRDKASPFRGLVRIRLDGDPPGATPGFVPELTVRQLIDGGGRGSRGWRSDDEFYEIFVKPAYPVRTDWDMWGEGSWRRYWFGFWAEVAAWYNEKSSDILWGDAQSNLTKAVALRTLQKLFMDKAVERVRGVLSSRETLVEVLGEKVADDKLAARVKNVSLPPSVEEFRTLVRDWFLKDGIPVRVFEYPWVSSLDDPQGQQSLYDEFEEAWRYSRDPGRRYRAQNSKVFTTEDS